MWLCSPFITANYYKYFVNIPPQNKLSLLTSMTKSKKKKKEKKARAIPNFKRNKRDWPMGTVEQCRPILMAQVEACKHSFPTCFPFYFIYSLSLRVWCALCAKAQPSAHLHLICLLSKAFMDISRKHI